MKSIGRIVILVRDYEEAIAFYCEKLGFEVIVDIDAAPLRFVHIYLPEQRDVGIWLLQSTSVSEGSRVGRQTEGQPCAVLYTDDLHRDFRELGERGVIFTKEPESGTGAKYAHFEDLYGNEFVLVELES